MLWYFLFPLLVFILATTYRQYKWCGPLVTFLMLFFSMFRGNTVGTDTITYMENYENFVRLFLTDPTYVESGKTEILMYALYTLIWMNNLSPRLIIWFFSIVTFFFLYWGCRRHKVNVPMFMLFYILMTFYLLSLNIARQMMVISICFYASSFLQEGRLMKKMLFFIFVAFASLFHTSAVVCLVLYPLAFIKLNGKKIGKVVYIFTILGFFLPWTKIILTIISFIPMLSIYSDLYGLESGEYGVSGVSVVGIIYKIVFVTLCYNIYKKKVSGDKTDLYDNLFLFALFIMGLFATSGSLATYRIKFYYTIFICLYLSQYFSTMWNKKTVKWNEYICVCFIQFIQVSMESLGYKPYNMYFNL